MDDKGIRCPLNLPSSQKGEELSSILALLLSATSKSSIPRAMNVNAVVLSTKSRVRKSRGNPMRNVPQTNASLMRTFSYDSYQEDSESRNRRFGRLMLRGCRKQSVQLVFAKKGLSISRISSWERPWSRARLQGALHLAVSLVYDTGFPFRQGNSREPGFESRRPHHRTLRFRS